MRQFEIYYSNLDQMTQEELCEKFNTSPEKENWELSPLAVVEREEEEG